MKKTTQMRINNQELLALYNLLIIKTESFVDHYKEDGTPVYVYSEVNEIYMRLYHKMMNEFLNRELYKEFNDAERIHI